MTDPLTQALHSDGPNPDLAEKLDLYGRFVGAWTFDATRHLEDGTVLTGRGEVHFGWVLEGKAIQDVWILPARNTGAQTSLGTWTFYGTTLRVYDPGADAWHIFWSDPRNQYFSRQLGRAEGDTIVQQGVDARGSSVRWSFFRITENSFRWLGECAHDGSADWRLEVEFLARRITPA
ncbi:hypothetical protein [Mesorhizobium helmanticense]|uniref:DUF1579 domain-containing protein n=1 Tax=Mesorhizobium helmanticense TaxID=1776423 RepID=A0A2T4J268_9HYPH|nr:hypothetical protein [Mesorhizobium helmanticense]PTE11923.1 hypothetical protein C9427_02435 [Mesorhizobium helmanticense]